MHKFINFGRTRHNPHKVWTGRSMAEEVSSKERRQIGKAIANLEAQVWSEIGDGEYSDLETVMATLDHHKDVVVGVAYKSEDDELGPYSAYVIAYEVDPEEAEQDIDIEELEAESGISYDELIEMIPSGKLFYIEDMVVDKSLGGVRQGMAMFKDLLNRMRELGHGFVGLARQGTGYKLLKSREKKGDLAIVYDEAHDDDFFGEDDGVRLVIGYFNPTDKSSNERSFLDRLLGRANPYSQTDSEGYLINPSKYNTANKRVEWFHFSNKRLDRFAPSKERKFSFFGGDFGDFEHHIIFNWRGTEPGVLYTVKLKPLAKASLLNSQTDLFKPLPNKMHDELFGYGGFLEDTLAEIESSFYIWDDLVESLPHIAAHFATFSCMRGPLAEKLKHQNQSASPESIGMYLISLYSMSYRAVQSLFFEESYGLEHYGLRLEAYETLSELGVHGWFEKEMIMDSAGVNIGVDLHYFDVEIVDLQDFDPN